MRHLGGQRGDTLVEVVMSIAILGAVLTTAYSIANESYRVGISAREHTQAAYFAQDQAEKLRTYRDNQAVTSVTQPGHLFQSSALWPNGQFTMQIQGGDTLALAPLPAGVEGDCTDIIPTCKYHIVSISHTDSFFQTTIDITWTNSVTQQSNTLSIPMWIADKRVGGQASCNVAGVC